METYVRVYKRKKMPDEKVEAPQTPQPITVTVVETNSTYETRGANTDNVVTKEKE